MRLNIGDGNNNSHGNNWSYGNNNSNGNNWSYGNNNSNGNNNSHGNNWSYGNNNSHGNNWSDGNNWSYGNNRSYGNNWSIFCFNCKGTHKSIFCFEKKGIAYMILNQQLTKEQSKDFYDGLVELLDGFLPYTINFIERKQEGRHKENKETNNYVKEYIPDTEIPYTKQYHDAWSRFTKKQELIEYIKSKDYLEDSISRDILEKVTGI